MNYFVYVMFRPDDGSPFWVGKGSGDRIKHSKFVGRIGNNPHKNAILSKARRDEKDIPVVKIAAGLTNEQAHDLERSLILAIGRKVDGGPLANVNEGGEGVNAGWRHTPETIELMKAKRALRPPVSDETRKRMSKSQSARPPETRANFLASNYSWSGKTRSDETKAKMSAAVRRRAPPSDETRAKMSASAKLRATKRKNKETD